MAWSLRKYEDNDLESIISLSLDAWAPVFVSIEAAMDAEVFGHFYPDWRKAQADAVRNVCQDDSIAVWIAEEGGVVVGFVALKFDEESEMGEIYMIAVSPLHQKKGIAGALTDLALAEMKKAGMQVAMVETGADPGHAPARRTYEKAGFRNLPAARYFKKL